MHSPEALPRWSWYLLKWNLLSAEGWLYFYIYKPYFLVHMFYHLKPGEFKKEYFTQRNLFKISSHFDWAEDKYNSLIRAICKISFTKLYNCTCQRPWAICNSLGGVWNTDSVYCCYTSCLPMCLWTLWKCWSNGDFSQPDSEHCGTFEAGAYKAEEKSRESKYKKFQGRVLELIVLKGLESCPERRQPAWPDWYIACDHVNDFMVLS